MASGNGDSGVYNRCFSPNTVVNCQCGTCIPDTPPGFSSINTGNPNTGNTFARSNLGSNFVPMYEAVPPPTPPRANLRLSFCSHSDMTVRGLGNGQVNVMQQPVLARVPTSYPQWSRTPSHFEHLHRIRTSNGWVTMNLMHLNATSASTANQFRAAAAGPVHPNGAAGVQRGGIQASPSAHMVRNPCYVDPTPPAVVVPQAPSSVSYNVSVRKMLDVSVTKTESNVYGSVTTETRQTVCVDYTAAVTTSSPLQDPRQLYEVLSPAMDSYVNNNMQNNDLV